MSAIKTGEQVRELRMSLKLGIREFGVLVGFSQAHIARVEKGISEVSDNLSIAMQKIVDGEVVPMKSPPHRSDGLEPLIVKLQQRAKELGLTITITIS